MTNGVKSDLHLLYKMSVQELGFFKQQQWRVTNYAALIYGAIVVVADHIKPLSPNEHLVLAVVAFLALIGGILLVFNLTYAIEVRRARLEAVRKHTKISGEFRKAWRAMEKNPNDDNAVLALLLAVLFGGLVVVLHILIPKLI